MTNLHQTQMNLLCKSIQTLSFFTPPTPYSLHPIKTTSLRQCHRTTPPPQSTHHPQPQPEPASTSDIDMIQTKSGTFISKPKKVVILWDLDNKPPRGPPYNAAIALKSLATHFGEISDVSAYANRHAFIHLPDWVRDQRRQQRRQDILEKQGVAVPPTGLYVCSVCGRKLKTNLDLKKHFKNLHVKEREKKLNRMKSLKGKKRQRFKEKFISGNHKYMEAARSLIVPKTGYGLAGELRRAGVFVKTVEDKPQAADWALKKQMMHSMSCGVDWLVLVSDDSDFSEMLRRAREANLGTVVVGDWDRALGRHADLWVEWRKVENGEVKEEDLVLRRRNSEFVDDNDDEEGVFVSSFDENGLRIESVLDELVKKGNESKVSVFSQGEDDYDDESDYFSDSDDEEEDGWSIQ
uniref:uncharacterized protein LOC122589208 n=1 Tax=Erigeron canadensis TaxID=72917 RepID=UPI001CB92645|nr:uncharacterized protein LOC122589208 [Erigeron canadensis]XP_043617393.1 uncharacterized protein LOC122589208 [Erigeron canadensis]XP_043617394.1 uncharacterized protein LOC122589208 [Erigeron canadensis]